jgi:hypothetical protein
VLEQGDVKMVGSVERQAAWVRHSERECWTVSGRGCIVTVAVVMAIASFLGRAPVVLDTPPGTRIQFF